MKHYKPSWKDGIETRQEESMWPYASCVIANQNIITQNIGVLKGMAKDKAKNRKEDVPVILHLPGRKERIIVFHPNGTQELVKDERSEQCLIRKTRKSAGGY